MPRKIISLDGWGRISLYEFIDLIDIDKVEFYSIKLNKNKTLTLKFYDKKRKLLKLYGK